MWRGAFFLGCLLLGLGTPEFSLDWDEEACACGFDDDAGSLRRELKDEMNSIDCGESPRSCLK